MPRLQNKRIERNAEYFRQQAVVVAQQAANVALSQWYVTAFRKVERMITEVQREENLAQVAAIPNWQLQKGAQNGYVMIVSSVNLEPRPVIIELDYNKATGHSTGGISYRGLHQQIRQALRLRPECSLRIRKYRPWIVYMVKNFWCPEHLALPSHDSQCRFLLGTTLLVWTYVHLTEEKPAGFWDLHPNFWNTQ